MTHHVVMMSGGIGSWAAAKRVAQRHGAENVTLLFADVKGNSTDDNVGEDPDTYRFLTEAAANVGAPLVRVADGRTIWEVFRDVRFLGNTRLASCSHLLKQAPCRAWLEEHHPDPANVVVHVGIDWSESHRAPKIVAGYLPYRAECPMTEPPYIDKQGMIRAAEAEGLRPPALYARGYAHNNCGGGCVRAGQGQFAHLLADNPTRYATWEAEEQRLREHLGRDVAILRDRTGGQLRPLPLTVLRERIEADTQVDLFDIGGCGCFTDET